MTEVIAFPDAEAATVAYLKAQLAARSIAATVATHVSNPRPDPLVQVYRTGGPRSSLVVDAAQLTFDCWADLETDAADLARMVRALVWAMPGLSSTAYRVQEMTGPQNYPDPASGSARYRFSVIVSARGSAI